LKLDYNVVMNLKWQKARLLPAGLDIFTANFYPERKPRSTHTNVYFACLNENHSNRRVLVVGKLGDHRTVKVVTTQLASAMLDPLRTPLPADIAASLTETCNKEGVLKRLVGEEEALCQD